MELNWDNLNSHTVVSLRQACKDRGIKLTPRLRKANIISLLEEYHENDIKNIELANKVLIPPPIDENKRVISPLNIPKDFQFKRPQTKLPFVQSAQDNKASSPSAFEYSSPIPKKNAIIQTPPKINIDQQVTPIISQPKKVTFNAKHSPNLTALKGKRMVPARRRMQRKKYLVILSASMALLVLILFLQAFL